MHKFFIKKAFFGFNCAKKAQTSSYQACFQSIWRNSTMRQVRDYAGCSF